MNQYVPVWIDQEQRLVDSPNNQVRSELGPSGISVCLAVQAFALGCLGCTERGHAR